MEVFCLYLNVFLLFIVISFFSYVQVNPELKHSFEEKGFHFVGQDVEGERMEIIELDGQFCVCVHPCFMVC